LSNEKTFHTLVIEESKRAQKELLLTGQAFLEGVEFAENNLYKIPQIKVLIEENEKLKKELQELKDEFDVYVNSGGYGI
jgi:hypothetical protein